MSDESDDYQNLLRELREGATELASLVEDMARERGDLAGLLVAIGSDDPAESTWARFVAAIEEHREEEALPEALREALVALESWPDELRVAPQAWWNAAQEPGSIPPGWEAVRALVATGSHQGFEPCRNEEALAPLTIVRVAEDVVSTAQLARAPRLRDLAIDSGSSSRLDPPEDLEGIGGLGRLEVLRLTLVRNADLRPLARLGSLRELSLTFELHGSEAPVDLAPLADLRKLTSLTLREEIRPFASLAPLGALGRLTSLVIVRPSRDLAPLAGLNELRELELSRVEEWPEGFRLPSGLTTLRLFDVEGLASLASLGPLSALRRLEVYNAPALSDAAGLAACTGLERLLLQGARLGSLEGLGSLARLETLQLSDQPELGRVEAGQEQTALREVALIRCPKLSDLSGLVSFKGLRRIVLDRLEALEDLAPLAALGRLEEVVLQGCPRVRSVEIRPGVRVIRG